MAVRSGPWPQGESHSERDVAARLELSIVVPMHDEQDNVEALYQALMPALEELERSFEVIVVDGGSRDETYPRLRRADR